MSSLWGEEFEIKEDQVDTKKILNKIKHPRSENDPEAVMKSKKATLQEKLNLINVNVHKTLGRYEDTTTVIRSKESLKEYFDKAIENDVLAVDTETNNSLDPLTCKMMGFCMYTPGMDAAYVPMHHVDLETGEEFPWQVTEKDLKEQLDRLGDVKIFTHNGSFDYQVIKCTTGYKIKPYWDTMVGAFILDENEKSYGLKSLYSQKVDPSIEKYSIDPLFEHIEYKYVAPEIFALYSATDAYITYRLYLYEKSMYDLPENKDLYHVLMDIEVPLIEVLSEMELKGCYIDQDYAKTLAARYQSEIEDIDKEIAGELEELHPQIDDWRLTPEANYKPLKKDANGESKGKSKSESLPWPINVASASQLSILLYDVLDVGVIDKKNPRGTGEDILKKIDLPLCKAILKRRTVSKLLSTYVEKLPASVSPVDHRLHGRFKSTGTATGRLSSSDPNLQNIPSENKTIRCLFKPEKGYKYVSADFSQAEPRVLAWLSQDEIMMGAYEQKRDLYAEVASLVYNNNYEDNLEFNPDGSMNYEGKERRSSCKSLILGIMYGRGPASIAEQIHKSTAEAQQLIDDFYGRFPKVKQWVDGSKQMCRDVGYVTTLEGRRRRLPDISLPEYSFKLTDAAKQAFSDFNPFLECEDGENESAKRLIEMYKKRCGAHLNRNDYAKLQSEALQNGVVITRNGGFISEAERQSVNARIQGSSADITKKAMIKIYHDPKLRELGFNLILTIHDELIGECPEENAEEAGQRLVELMLEAPKPRCTMPFKCDYDINDYWYQTEYTTLIREDYEVLCRDWEPAWAFEELVKEHPERPREFLQDLIAA